jgi:hypothetical protein
MVLGLFVMLLGVRPYDVHLWHMSMFWDAAELPMPRFYWTGETEMRCLSEAIGHTMSRKVMDVWAESIEHRGGRQSLFRDQYNALGRLNLPALQRIVSAKYERGAAFNRQHPFVEVLFSDIVESGESLDLSELVREALPPAFHRLA